MRTESELKLKWSHYLLVQKKNNYFFYEEFRSTKHESSETSHSRFEYIYSEQKLYDNVRMCIAN